MAKKKYLQIAIRRSRRWAQILETEGQEVDHVRIMSQITNQARGRRICSFLTAFVTSSSSSMGRIGRLSRGGSVGVCGLGMRIALLWFRIRRLG